MSFYADIKNFVSAMTQKVFLFSSINSKETNIGIHIFHLLNSVQIACSGFEFSYH